ncbi:hypothetical protein P4E94_18625 [Pontiellaceae bacterium B12219]|nr:hypothetical protein [Pontiellaceae bacterium B12219]
MNAHRGNESTAHLEAKVEIGRLFSNPAWAVFFEQRNTDILIMHNATRITAAVEVESSPRNVSRNLERNTHNGCGVMAVVALNSSHLPRITSKAIEHSMSYPGTCVMVFPHTTNGCQALRGWLSEIARFRQELDGGWS